jgi:DNA primase large subunit
MGEIIFAILSSGTITGLVGWILARRKNMADAQKSELDVVEQAIGIWREMTEEFKKEIDALRAENALLRKEITNLRCTNQKIVKALERINAENLDQVVTELKAKLNEA